MVGGGNTKREVERLAGLILSNLDTELRSGFGTRHMLEGTAAIVDALKPGVGVDELHVSDVELGSDEHGRQLGTLPLFDSELREHLGKESFDLRISPNGNKHSLTLPGWTAEYGEIIKAMWQSSGIDVSPDPAISDETMGEDSPEIRLDAERRLHESMRDAFEEMASASENVPGLEGRVFTLATHRWQETDRISRLLVKSESPVDYRLGYLLPLSSRLAAHAKLEPDEQPQLKVFERPLGQAEPGRPWKSVVDTSVATGLTSLVGNHRLHGSKGCNNFHEDKELKEAESLIWERLGVQPLGRPHIMVMPLTTPRGSIGAWFMLLNKWPGPSDMLGLLEAHYRARDLFRRALRTRFYGQMAGRLRIELEQDDPRASKVAEHWKVLADAFGYRDAFRLEEAGDKKESLGEHLKEFRGLVRALPAGESESEMAEVVWPEDFDAMLSRCKLVLPGPVGITSALQRLNTALIDSLNDLAGKSHYDVSKAWAKVHPNLHSIVKHVRAIQADAVEVELALDQPPDLDMDMLKTIGRLFRGGETDRVGRWVIESVHNYCVDSRSRCQQIIAAALLDLTNHPGPEAILTSADESGTCNLKSEWQKWRQKLQQEGMLARLKSAGLDWKPTDGSDEEGRIFDRLKDLTHEPYKAAMYSLTRTQLEILILYYGGLTVDMKGDWATGVCEKFPKLRLPAEESLNGIVVGSWLFARDCRKASGTDPVVIWADVSQKQITLTYKTKYSKGDWENTVELVLGPDSREGHRSSAVGVLCKLLGSDPKTGESGADTIMSGDSVVHVKRLDEEVVVTVNGCLVGMLKELSS